MSADDFSTSQSAPQTVARGAVLMLLFKLVERGIGFLSVLLLARLLTPADFGLVAMASTVVAMIELVSAFGFDTALIQRSDAKRTHFDTAWTFQVLFGVASAVLLVVCTSRCGCLPRAGTSQAVCRSRSARLGAAAVNPYPLSQPWPEPIR